MFICCLLVVDLKCLPVCRLSGEIERPLVKAPLAAAISPYLISLVRSGAWTLDLPHSTADWRPTNLANQAASSCWLSDLQVCLNVFHSSLHCDCVASNSRLSIFGKITCRLYSQDLGLMFGVLWVKVAPTL